MDIVNISIGCLSAAFVFEAIAYYRSHSLQKRIERERPFSSEELRNKLMNLNYRSLYRGSPESKWTLDKTTNEISGPALVTGILNSDSPIQSISTGEDNLAIQVLGRYSKSETPNVEQPSNFMDLFKWSQGRLAWNIAPNLKICSNAQNLEDYPIYVRGDVHPALIKDLLEKPRKSLGKSIGSSIGSMINLSTVRRAIEKVAFGDDNKKETNIHEVNRNEAELGVQIKTSVCAYGVVILNLKNGDFQILPQFLGRTRVEILSYLKTKTNALKWLLITTGAALLVLGLPKLRKFIQNYSTQKTELLPETTLPDDYLCCICMTNPKNVILNPCHHFIMCRRCLDSLDTARCPKCRVEFEDYLVVYH